MPRHGRDVEQQHRDLDKAQSGNTRGRPSTTPPPRAPDRVADDDEHPPRHPGEGDYR